MIKFDETLSLVERKDGFWLYDSIKGMNLSMRAKSKDEAFFEALKYYQKHSLKIEKELEEITNKVDEFVSFFSKEEY